MLIHQSLAWKSAHLTAVHLAVKMAHARAAHLVGCSASSLVAMMGQWMALRMVVQLELSWVQYLAQSSVALTAQKLDAYLVGSWDARKEECSAVYLVEMMVLTMVDQKGAHSAVRLVDK